MPATASLRDCSALVTATEEAGGQAPDVLTNIIGGAHLFNTRPAPVDPAHVIVRAAADGTLTAERLDELLVTGASQQRFAGYAGEVRQRSERLFTEEFHRALKDGAADELLNSMRSVWDAHAAAVAEARSEINAESRRTHFGLRLAGLVEALATIARTSGRTEQDSRVARQFGPRIGNFPMITEFANTRQIPARRRGDLVRRRQPRSRLRRVPPAGPAAPPAPTVQHAVAPAHRDPARARYGSGQQRSGSSSTADPCRAGSMRKVEAHEFPRPVNPFAERKLMRPWGQRSVPRHSRTHTRTRRWQCQLACPAARSTPRSRPHRPDSVTGLSREYDDDANLRAVCNHCHHIVTEQHRIARVKEAAAHRRARRHLPVPKHPGDP